MEIKKIGFSCIYVQHEDKKCFKFSRKHYGENLNSPWDFICGSTTIVLYIDLIRQRRKCEQIPWAFYFAFFKSSSNASFEKVYFLSQNWQVSSASP